MHFEAAPVEFDNLARHRQAEAQADGALGVERFGRPRGTLGVEAAAGVAHVNAHPARAVGLDFHGGDDGDGLVVGRGLQGV